MEALQTGQYLAPSIAGLYEGIMLTGPGARGPHCLLIPIGGLRNVYSQV